MGVETLCAFHSLTYLCFVLCDAHCGLALWSQVIMYWKKKKTCWILLPEIKLHVSYLAQLHLLGSEQQTNIMDVSHLMKVSNPAQHLLPPSAVTSHLQSHLVVWRTSGVQSACLVRHWEAQASLLRPYTSQGEFNPELPPVCFTFEML